MKKTITDSLTSSNQSPIDMLIGKFTQLKEDEKEFAIDILKKIFAESRRNAIAVRAKKASSNLKVGKVNRGTSKDLYNDLEND
jgi:hypothetical protein